MQTKIMLEISIKHGCYAGSCMIFAFDLTHIIIIKLSKQHREIHLFFSVMSEA